LRLLRRGDNRGNPRSDDGDDDEMLEASMAVHRTLQTGSYPAFAN
jgi:hypothetical protein